MSIKYGSGPPPPLKKPKKGRKSRAKRHPKTAGRPAHVPDAQSRTTCEVMMAGGMTQVEIARALSIDVSTLQRHYRPELDSAGSNANAKVVATLYRLAVSGKCPAATFFFLKTRMRWRETGNGDGDQQKPTDITVRWADPEPAPEPKENPVVDKSTP